MCSGKKLWPGAALRKENQPSIIKAAISSPLSACVKQRAGRTARQLKHPNNQEIKPNPGDSGGGEPRERGIITDWEEEREERPRLNVDEMKWKRCGARCWPV